MAHGGHQRGEQLGGGEGGYERRAGVLREHVDGLRHVRGVHRRVVRVGRVVAALHLAEERHQICRIQPEP